MAPHKTEFDLQSFHPYKLAALNHAVSQSIAQVYAARFDLSRAEWRVLVSLSDRPNSTAKEVGIYTSQDKMKVSRAVKRLETNEYIVSNDDLSDRRNKKLILTESGTSLLNEIIPLVVEREQFLLASLTKFEIDQFNEISSKILSQANELLAK